MVARMAVQEEAARRAEEEQNQKLYDRVMLLHYILASEEDKVRMVEPIGWHPLLATNMSLQMQVEILQGRVDAMNGRSFAPASSPPNRCKARPAPPQ
jgi:hypothetical protein